VTDADRVRQRADLLFDLHRPQEALDLLLTGLSELGDHPELLCLAARAELELERPRDALDLALRAAGADPTMEWPLRLQAIAALRIGRSLDALTAAKAAVALGPDEWVTHHTLAHVYLGIRGNMHEAWYAASRATELAPEVADTHATIGRIALELNDPQIAERALGEALRLDPGHGGARNDFGRLQLGRMEYLPAAAHFAAAAAGDVRDVAAVANIDIALAAAMRRVTFFAGLLCVIPGIGTAVNRGSEAIETGLVTLALLTMLITWHGVRLRWALRSVLRAYLRQLPRRDRALTLAGVLTLTALTSLVLMCVVPPGSLRVVLLALGAGSVVGCWAMLMIRKPLKT
jgi:tetratricopeptide (TPR) repeat protein